MKYQPRVESGLSIDGRFARRDFLKGLTSVGVMALLAKFVAACSPASQKSSAAPANPVKDDTSPAVLSTSDLGELILPEPKKAGGVSIEEALQKRRSIRTYSGKPLTVPEVSQLTWAAQGITNSKGYRTAPSAMMSFTLKTYLVIGDVDGLEKGVYLYRPAGHRLMKLLDGEYIPQLSDANAGTYFVRGGALYFVFAATNRSSSDFDKYQHMEVGHATQNVYLQCVSLGLGTVVNGGFNADRTRELLQISATERLLYIMPVGRMTGA